MDNSDPIAAIFDRMGRGEEVSPEDIAMLSNWFMVQELQNQYGQTQNQSRQLDLSDRQLDQQLAEQRFVQEQYFPWYTGDYFDFQKQMAQNDLTMSDDERRKSANYLESQRNQTEQARLGAQVAKLNLWQELGFIPASSAVREQQRQRRIAELNRGREMTPPRRIPEGGY